MSPPAPRGTVRPLADSDADVAGVADLYARMRGRPDLAPRAARLLRRVFLENPWRTDDLPSLVYETPEGRTGGFLGCVPRPMTLRGAPVRVAVSSHFLVEPESRAALAGIALLRRFLDGPQDLAFADDATEMGRRVWEGLGGVTSTWLSLNWIRPLQPVRYLLRQAGRSAARVTSRALDLVARLADAGLRPLIGARFGRFEPRGRVEPLDPQAIVEMLAAAHLAEALKPVYDGASLSWLLAVLADISNHGPLLARQVVDDDGRRAGWYVAYVRRNETAEVLQIGARPDARGDVLEHLLRDADARGAIAVRGRLQPALFEALSSRQCIFRRDGLWTLLHARDASLLDVVQRGDALLSRLEGEWWIRLMAARSASA